MLPRCSRRPHRDGNIIPEAAIRVLDASAISAEMGVALISSVRPRWVSVSDVGSSTLSPPSSRATAPARPIPRRPRGTRLRAPRSPAVRAVRRSSARQPWRPSLQSARHLEDQSLRTSESLPSRHPLLTMCVMVTMSISTARASRVKVSLGMDCTTDLAVPARLSTRAKQRCVRDYRPCHCWYFLITL
jgi:hypothetical protein